jgi:hypothetical protein
MPTFYLVVFKRILDFPGSETVSGMALEATSVVDR